MTLPAYVQGAWFVGALLFIFGLKGMSSPASARRGIIIAGYGMLIAIAATFLIPGLRNLGLMALALVIGGGAAWISGQKVKMTDMPQMVAIYNGMGGGAAAAIAAVEFAKGDAHGEQQSHLAEYGTTGLLHQLGDDFRQPAEVGSPHPQQNTCNGQDRYWQHQRLTDLLQIRESIF